MIISQTPRCLVVLLLTLASAWSETQAAEKLYGVGLHMPWGYPKLAQARSLMKALGVNSFRDDLFWSRLEPAEGPIQITGDMRPLAQLAVAAPGDGLTPLLILGYGNKRYFRGFPLEDAAIAAYTRYASDMITRFARTGAIFEVWNEWNIGAGVKPREPGGAQAYVRLLRRVKEAANHSIPGTKILGGALAERDEPWVKSFLAAGGLRYCDGFSVHPYNHARRDRSAEEVASWLDRLDRTLREANRGTQVPIYVTEIGWPNQNGPLGTGESTTAQRLFKMFVLLHARPYIAGAWWYDMMDDGSDPSMREHRFGLLRQTGEPKPAFAALALFGKEIMHARLRHSTESPDYTLMDFVGPNNETLLAVWRREGSRQQFLRMTGTGWTVHASEPTEIARVEAGLRKTGKVELLDWPLILKGGKSSIKAYVD